MAQGNGKDRDPLELFIKLLGMTGSSSDGEALLAMRRANEYLKTKLNSDWESFVRSKIKVEADPFLGAPTPTFKTPVYGAAPTGGGYTASPPPPPKVYNDVKEIQGYFDKLSLRQYPRSIQDNINRVEAIWAKNGQLIFADYDFIRRQAQSRKRY